MSGWAGSPPLSSLPAPAFAFPPTGPEEPRTAAGRVPWLLPPPPAKCHHVTPDPSLAPGVPLGMARSWGIARPSLPGLPSSWQPAAPTFSSGEKEKRKVSPVP